MFQQKEINIVPNTNMGKEEEKGVNAMHGNIYQLKLLILFLCRGIFRQYNFRLGTEIKEAKKFDDLVFEYKEGDKIQYRLLQAKHRLGESRKITVHNLLEQPKGDYSLIKYFLSYRDSKEQELFTNGTIKDIIICTNIGFNVKDLKKAKIEVEEIVDKDDILDMRCGEKQSVRYKFKFNEAIADILKRQITCSDKEINDYLNHLVFAINQPNEEELGQIIKQEIGKEFDIITTENAYNKLFQIMLKWLIGKNSNQFLSHDKGKMFFDKIKVGFPIWFNMKDPVKSFSGRTQQLHDLHILLQTSPLVSITGLGGVGKTELARKYIEKYAADYDNKVIWINAESYQNLAESFRRLSCDILRINTKNANNEEKEMSSIVEGVYVFFSRGKSLFVFDNAEKYKHRNDFDCGIDQFLPSSTYNRPHVLITSRNQELSENIKVLQLDVFSEEEAMEFIKMSLNLKNNAQAENIKELAGRLHFLPLALQQAVAYIRVLDKKYRFLGSKFEISNYLMKYNEKADDVLNFEFPEDSDNDYTRTAFTTWNITLDVIKRKEGGDDALKILYIISYLAPEGIPTDIFSDLISDNEKLVSAIQLLVQYSMVTPEHAMVNVHRLVQQVIRMHLQKQNREEEILEEALQLFNGVNITSRNINHAISIWNYSNKYNKLVKKFQQISTYISCKLMNSSRFEDAYLFEKNTSELLRRLPPEYKAWQGLSSALSNMGWALIKLGKYDIALETFQDALNIQNNNSELNNYHSLKIKCNISHVLVAQSKYNEALTNSEEVLVAWKKRFGTNHRDTLLAEHDVAEILDHKGEHNRALQLLENVYNLQTAESDPYKFDIAQTKNSLANVYFHLCRYDESLQLLQQIYNEPTLEKNHAVILQKQKNIAEILFSQGKYSNAFEVYQRVLNAEIDIFGENHPDVLCTCRHVAEVLRELGEYDRALEICQDVVENLLNVLASDHLNIIDTQITKARILSEQQKYSDALTIFHDVLKHKKLILGDDHPDTVKVKYCIAVIYSKQGESDMAFQQYKDILTIQKHNLGENHLDYLATKNNIGMYFYYKKEDGNALSILKEVFNVLETMFPNYPQTFLAKNNIALVLHDQGEHDEALKILKEVADFQEITFGKHYPKLTYTKIGIAFILLEQKEYSEALTYFEYAFENLNKLHGPEHLETTRIHDLVEQLSKADNNRLTDGEISNINIRINLIDLGRYVNTW